MYKTPDEMLEDISKCMDHNISMFESGGEVDMQIFDEKVRQFCGMLSSLPKYEAKKYEGNLKEVIQRLNNFIPKLEASRDELENKINSLNKRHFAYNAYGNALILAMQAASGDE